MPRGLSDHAAAVMGGKIYVTGGETDQGFGNLTCQGLENSVYVFDPQADAWTQLASMMFPRKWHASAVAGDKLYVFGGSQRRWVLRTAEVYDPASDSWAHAPSLTSPRSWARAVPL